MTFDGLRLGSAFQGATFITALVALIGALGYWIKGMPERARVKHEGTEIAAKIEEDIRREAAGWGREFRKEVHSLRNDLQIMNSKLHLATMESARRADKLDMMLFILTMVMDELQTKESNSAVLTRSRILLQRIEEKARDKDHSPALNAAEDTVGAANLAARQVKASEAKDGQRGN